VTPRTDHQIPAMVNASQAAAAIGITKQGLEWLVDDGQLAVTRVGRSVLLAQIQVDALARARHQGRVDWAAAGPLPELPKLVNTTEFAKAAGLPMNNASVRVHRLYQQGKFPGQLVGDDGGRQTLILRYDVALGYRAILQAGGDRYPDQDPHGAHDD